MLNSNQKSQMCEAYADLLKKTKSPATPVKPSRSRMTWKKSIQDYLSTKDFKRELCYNFPDFKGYDQHDAHEFCTSLLDIMCKELNRVKRQPKYKELKIKSSESIEKQAK